MNRPSGILFDLGGTVLKQETFDAIAGTERVLQLADNPETVSLQEVRAAANELDAVISASREASPVEFPSQAFNRLVFERFRMAFEMSPAELELAFWKAACVFAPEPGIARVLDAAKQRGLPCGIVGNSVFGGHVLLWELAQHGLADRLTFVMSSADYGLRKPHPLFFLAAAGKLGLEPRHVWFVGDRPQDDIAGALEAGMTAIWYSSAGAPCDGPQPHATVPHWDAFLELLRGSLGEAAGVPGWEHPSPA